MPWDFKATLRERSVAFGERAAAKQFEGRKGHGGNPALAERHLSRQQLTVLLAAAYEAGAEMTLAECTAR